jgi:hypothetical protein
LDAKTGIDKQRKEGGESKFRKRNQEEMLVARTCNPSYTPEAEIWGTEI